MNKHIAAALAAINPDQDLLAAYRAVYETLDTGPTDEAIRDETARLKKAEEAIEAARHAYSTLPRTIDPQGWPIPVDPSALPALQDALQDVADCLLDHAMLRFDHHRTCTIGTSAEVATSPAVLTLQSQVLAEVERKADEAARVLADLEAKAAAHSQAETEYQERLAEHRAAEALGEQAGPAPKPKGGEVKGTLEAVQRRVDALKQAAVAAHAIKARMVADLTLQDLGSDFREYMSLATALHRAAANVDARLLRLGEAYSAIGARGQIPNGSVAARLKIPTPLFDVELSSDEAIAVSVAWNGTVPHGESGPAAS